MQHWFNLMHICKTCSLNIYAAHLSTSWRVQEYQLRKQKCCWSRDRSEYHKSWPYFISFIPTEQHNTTSSEVGCHIWMGSAASQNPHNNTELRNITDRSRGKLQHWDSWLCKDLWDWGLAIISTCDSIIDLVNLLFAFSLIKNALQSLIALHFIYPLYFGLN